MNEQALKDRLKHIANAEKKVISRSVEVTVA